MFKASYQEEELYWSGFHHNLFVDDTFSEESILSDSFYSFTNCWSFLWMKLIFKYGELVLAAEGVSVFAYTSLKAVAHL